MSEAEDTVAAALLQKPTRLSEVGRVGVEFFAEDGPRRVFALALGYYQKHERKNALDLPLARAVLERAGTKVARAILPVVEEYAGYSPISDAEFRDALSALAARRRKAVLRDRGREALEAALEGDAPAATRAMRAGLVEVEDVDLEDDLPTDIRSSVEIARARESLAREPVEVGGFDVGFPRLTRALSFRRRELTILAGYTGDGKSACSRTFAYNANVKSGARVLFVALEMDKEEMQTLFVAQHASTLDPRGVAWTDVLSGKAGAEDRRLYARALEDFESRGEVVDGVELSAGAAPIHVWAPLREVRFDQIADRVRSLREDPRAGVDIVVVDYLELVAAVRPSGQYRLDLKVMAEGFKALARECGVWIVVNHQISQAGRDLAEKRDPRSYRLRDLGESSGVGRAADSVVWIYTDDDYKDEREARIGVAKARKGRTVSNGFCILANYPRGFLAPLDDELGTPGGTE